jgi:siroheme synthase
MALAEAGVPFEIVPGLTTAVSAPALSGIPVTHRGLASGFAVVSGHAEAAYRPLLESLPSGSMTVVVLMGLGSRGALSTLLLGRGWRGDTPAAICLAAGTAQAHTWIGRLDALGAAPVASDHPDAPGTIVIGEVVRAGATIAAALFPHQSALAPALAASQAV